MKYWNRLWLSTAIISILLVVLLWRQIQDFVDQYDVVAYLEASISNLAVETIYHPEPLGSLVEDKIIVIAKMEHEDTSWIAEELPEYSSPSYPKHIWQRAIYIVNPLDPLKAAHKTPMNKGHEAMAYLTYVIDNYGSFPSVIAFLHAHRNGFFRAWHVDTPLHDNVDSLRALQLDFVVQNGYVNLRCNWNPGCKGSHRLNRHVNGKVWNEIFSGTTTPLFSVSSYNMTTRHRRSPPEFNPDLLKPMEVAAACCAQFAVSREQIHQRPVEDYIQIRHWLMNTAKDDAHSGRVLEFLWHVIFGKDKVYCPDQEQCYCQVYGRCS